MIATVTTRERPILFSGPMVRAILAGRKTQTRRVIKLWKGNHAHKAGCFRYDSCEDQWVQYGAAGVWCKVDCPYGVPGDRLWVRETWVPHLDGAIYKADDPEAINVGWKPSIHMPRAASRLTLEITGVRVERLHDISEADAIAEGMDGRYLCTDGEALGNKRNMPAVAQFAGLWREINGPDSWDANPWVWVVEFRRVEP